MKTIRLSPLVSLLFGFVCRSYGQQLNPVALDEIRNVLSKSDTRMRATGVDDPDRIALSADLLWGDAEFKNLASQADTFWEVSLSNIDKVAPTENTRMIFILLLQGLNQANYLRFLDKATSLCEQGKFSKSELYVAAFPTVMNNQILERNYRDAQVEKICQRCKQIWKGDSEKEKQFDKILNGQTGAGLISRENSIINWILASTVAFVTFILYLRHRRKPIRIPA